mmetsp:Transcript_20489/g.56811  ORF Transcript_20489/g.56811 Transcript_20489/m.56811 type:complete len:295 (+) Transcript_20489:583-1467(+)
MAMSVLQAVKIAGIVFVWFGIGAVLLFSNRLLLTTSGLRAPISLTVLHMAASCVFAHGTILFSRLKWQTFQSTQQCFSVMKLALSFGLSVVAGVYSFSYIPVSFSEMISSTTPLFTAFFAYFLLGEIGGNFISYAALVMVAVGAVLASDGEPMWDTLGFSLALFSVVLRAFKAVLQQSLLQNKEESLDSINLLRFISTYVVILLAPAAAIIEGPTTLPYALLDAHRNGNDSLPELLLLNVSAAFLVNWVQMQVTKMIGATVSCPRPRFSCLFCVCMFLVSLCRGSGNSCMQLMV